MQDAYVRRKLQWCDLTNNNTDHAEDKTVSNSETDVGDLIVSVSTSKSTNDVGMGMVFSIQDQSSSQQMNWLLEDIVFIISIELKVL